MVLSELVKSLGVQEFKARLIAELNTLVRENPDHQYVTPAQALLSSSIRPTCSYNCGPKYWDNGQYVAFSDSTEEQNKGCIFGRALRTMGVELGDRSVNIEYILNSVGIGGRFAETCLEIQAGQDTGWRWGDLNIGSLDGL